MDVTFLHPSFLITSVNTCHYKCNFEISTRNITFVMQDFTKGESYARTIESNNRAKRIDSN